MVVYGIMYMPSFFENIKGVMNMEVVALIGAIVSLVTALVNLCLSLTDRKKKSHRSDKR